uniref:Adenylate kinase isoenzyme 6 homolog n=1 Tax=Parascaris univalens TaxID=6257 RepID=A0A915ARS6_PARUN
PYALGVTAELTCETMGTPETRQRPNILITGSPGTGKTTLGQQLAERLDFDFIECGKEVREHELYSGYDEDLKCHILDEDKLLDHIEERLNDNRGGCIVDYHGCDFFPERWFDIVVVLRCDNTILYDRLAARGYDGKKIRENIECEIFGSLLEEALESYKQEIVHEMQSETSLQMSENVERITKIALSWKQK